MDMERVQTLDTFEVAFEDDVGTVFQTIIKVGRIDLSDDRNDMLLHGSDGSVVHLINDDGSGTITKDGAEFAIYDGSEQANKKKGFGGTFGGALLTSGSFTMMAAS